MQQPANTVMTHNPSWALAWSLTEILEAIARRADRNRRHEVARRQKTATQSRRVRLVETVHQPLINTLLLDVIALCLEGDSILPSLVKKAAGRIVLLSLHECSVRRYKDLLAKTGVPRDIFAEVVDNLVDHGLILVDEESINGEWTSTISLPNAGEEKLQSDRIFLNAVHLVSELKIGARWKAQRDPEIDVQFYANPISNVQKFPELPECLMSTRLESLWIKYFDWKTYMEQEIPEEHYSEKETFGDSYSEALSLRSADMPIEPLKYLSIKATAIANRQKVAKKRIGLKQQILINRQIKSGQNLRNTARREREASEKRYAALAKVELRKEKTPDGKTRPVYLDTDAVRETVAREHAKVEAEKQQREFVKAVARFKKELDRLQYLAHAAERKAKLEAIKKAREEAEARRENAKKLRMHYEALEANKLKRREEYRARARKAASRRKK
ncbi:MAG: hypothetical protein CYG60_16880 [Actinobacteria bacterium]|nr:MAG: hypothetical protein CYG60_16880 [Actinomycetota bacterium]